MAHLWVVEAYHRNFDASYPERKWKQKGTPALNFGRSSIKPPMIDGVYLTRRRARKAAREMEETNQYNQHHKTVKYRAVKYERV